MIQLYLNCGGMEKMVACIPLFLKHFVHICVRVNSRTSRNRYLVGKDKRKQPFSLYQYPGEGGRQPDWYSVGGSCCIQVHWCKHNSGHYYFELLVFSSNVKGGGIFCYDEIMSKYHKTIFLVEINKMSSHFSPVQQLCLFSNCFSFLSFFSFSSFTNGDVEHILVRKRE